MASVFYAQDKINKKCLPHLTTVLVVDPYPAASRLLADVLKQLGARTVLPAADEITAERLIVAYEPRMIFAECGGGVNGPSLVTRLRRGATWSRAVPVIMCTAEATEAALKAARDSGVHEFVCKPFTIAHVIKRIEAACLKPRDWIEAKAYVGPDRRRFNSAGYAGPRKREDDQAAPLELQEVDPNADVAVLARVLKAIQAALDGYDAQPQQAVRAMLEQSAELQALAFATEDADLKAAVLSLQRYLLAALESGSLQPDIIAKHAGALERLASAGGSAAERRGVVNDLRLAA